MIDQFMCFKIRVTEPYVVPHRRTAPGVGVGAMQREVYRRVHGWRDKVAREEDESTKYVVSSSLHG